MTEDTRKREIQTAAADLANCLIERNYFAGTYLAQLLLADDGDALRLFARALAWRLQRWPAKVMNEDDVTMVLRAAARDLIGGGKRAR
jgi:hypothetical protein